MVSQLQGEDVRGDELEDEEEEDIDREKFSGSDSDENEEEVAEPRVEKVSPQVSPKPEFRKRKARKAE